MRRKTILGIIWAGMGQYGAQAIHYGVILFLAVLLSPEDFGLLGISMIFIQFSQAIGELGLASALIERGDYEEPILSTVFWTTIISSLTLMLITVTSSDHITRFLGDQRAAPLLQVLAIVTPIISLSVVPRSLLEKDLNFRKIAIRDFAGEIAFGLVGCSFGLFGWGVWSLVGATIAQRLVGTVGLWLSITWKPSLKFSWNELKSILGFGLSASLSGVLNKSLQNIDYFVIGRWLGPEALGFYTLAFQIAVIPQRRSTYIVSRVAFPALSRTKENQRKLKRGFFDGVKHLLVLLTLFTISVILIAPWAIAYVYGDKWVATIYPMQILAIVGYFYSVDIFDALYFTLGRPHLRFVVIGVRLVVFSLSAIVFGVNFGIEGIAFSLLLAALVSWIISFLLGKNILNFPIIKAFENNWLSASIVLLAALVIVFTRIYLSDQMALFRVWIVLGIPLAFIYLFSVRSNLKSLYNSIVK